MDSGNSLRHFAEARFGLAENRPQALLPPGDVLLGDPSDFRKPFNHPLPSGVLLYAGSDEGATLPAESAGAASSVETDARSTQKLVTAACMTGKCTGWWSHSPGVLTRPFSSPAVWWPAVPMAMKLAE
jgi:hypothetical protein